MDTVDKTLSSHVLLRQERLFGGIRPYGRLPMTQDPALCGVLRQASRGDSKETHGLAGFGGAVASVRWISGGELGRERLLLDCFGCDSRTRQCWRKSSFGFTAICPVNGGQACDERSVSATAGRRTQTTTRPGHMDDLPDERQIGAAVGRGSVLMAMKINSASASTSAKPRSDGRQASEGPVRFFELPAGTLIDERTVEISRTTAWIAWRLAVVLAPEQCCDRGFRAVRAS